MASITTDDIVKEAGTYLPQNTAIIESSINRMDIALDMYTKPITKVKGLWPQGAALITNVVQGFAPVWNDMGAVQIDHKLLVNYRHKVNFGITPNDIESTYFADLYAENLKPEDMPITKYVIERLLLPKVVDDIAELSVNGVYDSGNLDVFGNAMNGIDAVLTNMLAGVPGTDHTPFKIPLTTLTDSNIVDQVTSFEKQLPSKVKGKVKILFMSETNKERYILQYEEQFGTNLLVNKDKMTTRLGNRTIVGIPGWDSDIIFGTVDGNFVRLIDIFDSKPAVTDIQKADYVVKFFMEFWKGYDFLVNELVFISNYADAEYGLGSTALNQKYFGFDGVTVA
jgi:hypothetical protein